MTLVSERTYGELFEQAGRWHLEVNRQLEERGTEMAQMEDRVNHVVNRFINGRPIHDIEPDPLYHLLQQQAHSLWVTEANVFEVATQVYKLMKEVLGQLDRPLFNREEMCSLYEMGYDTNHIILSQIALSQAKNLLSVSISNFEWRMRDFQEHHNRIISGLDAGWASYSKEIPSPSWISWIWPFPSPPAWLHEAKVRRPDLNLNVNLSDSPSSLLDSLSSQSILSQIPPINDWTQNLATLLAMKPYPREEKIPMLDTPRSVISEATWGSTSTEEPVASDPNSLFASVTPLFVSLVSSTVQCASEKLSILFTFAEAETIPQWLPEEQKTFVTTINTWNHEILTAPEKERDGLRNNQKQCAIDSYAQKLDDALQKFRRLKRSQATIQECLKGSRLSLSDGMQCEITEATITTLKKLRFPTQPIRECRKLTAKCAEDIHDFEKFQTAASRIVKESEPILDCALRDLKWSKDETTPWEEWTYNLGFNYFYLGEWLKGCPKDSFLPSLEETSQ